MSIDRKKKLVPLLLALFLVFSGCSNHEPEHVRILSPVAPLAVETIVPVLSATEAGGGEVLLVPKSAIFHNGELTGVFVVGTDNRLSMRWISTGRSINGDVVVLGGLNKGEFVVGHYDPALNEGVTVKKSPRVTEEVQNQ